MAVGADRGHIRHDRLDPLRREAMAMVSGMASLPARLSSAGGLDHWFGSVRRISRRGNGRVGRVPVQLGCSSWISACKSAICLRASSNCPRASFKAARSLPHSGQEATGLARGSFIYYKDTEVARNCNVFNDHQSLSRIIDARRGTGRLPTIFLSSLLFRAVSIE